MIKMFERLGRMVTAPVQQIDPLLREDEGDVFESLWLFIAAVAAMNLLTLYQASLFFEQRPFWVVQKLFSLVAFHGQSIFLFLAVWGALFWLSAKVFLKQTLPMGRILNGTSYFLCTFTLLIGSGAIVDMAGYDHWILPHHPIHSQLIWQNGEIVWSRYVFKCLATYALPTFLALKVLWRWKKQAPQVPLKGKGTLGKGIWLVFLVMLFTGGWAKTYEKMDMVRPILVGDTFPSRSLPWLVARPSDTQGSHNFAENTSGVRVIDFWASWCTPCRAGLPKLEKIAKDYKNKGVRVIGVNREPQDLPSARQVLAEMSSDFTSVVDRGNLAKAVGLQVLPTTYVLSPSGRVTFVHMGALDEQELRTAIDAALSD
jgi:thiol-disulfide isomerase/thioredoxin